MNRASATAALLLTAVALAGCSGFGNDPFGWGDERTYSTMDSSAAPMGGDPTEMNNDSAPPGQTMSGSGETTTP